MTPEHARLIDAGEELLHAMYVFGMAWDGAIHAKINTVPSYPFKQSFNDMTNDFYQWLEKLKEIQ